MKKRIILIIIFILILIIGYFVVRGGSKNSFDKPKNSTIVAFGDSLVAGNGSTEGNDFVSVLSRKIGVLIENFGHSGDTSADALARIDTVIERDPGIVILVIGGNDILRKVPIATTKDNISSIVETLQKNNTRVLLVGVKGAILNDPYADMYESITDEYDIAYMPNILSGLLGKSKYMSDAIHPNDIGYARIADRLSEILKPLVLE